MARPQHTFSLIFLLALLCNVAPTYGDPNPFPQKWPKKQGATQVEPNVFVDPNLDTKVCAGAADLAKKAVEEWASGANSDANDDWPASGEKNKKSGGNNPKNNASDTGEIMKAGTKEKAKKNLKDGAVDRSYDASERDALKNKYAGDGGFNPKITGDKASAEIIIEAVDTLPGFSDFGTANTQPSNDGNTKKKWTIRVRKKPKLWDDFDKGTGNKEYAWFCTSDDKKKGGNGDGQITNEDPKPKADEFDFYDTIKHELGHALSLDHSVPPAKPLKQFEEAPPPVNDDNLGGTQGPGNERSPGEDSSNQAIFVPTRLFFASDRPGGFGGFDIWYAQWNGTGWTAPVNAGSSINTSADETDPSVIHDELLFASNRAGGAGGFDLYRASVDGDTWLPPQALSSLNSPFNESHPTVSQRDRALFFASDRPGGLGGTDLWVANWNAVSFDWSALVNAGPSVNSAANDLDPAMSVDETLYFASDRTGGFGGFDIWQSDREGSVLLGAINSGSLLNSSVDEFSPNPSGDLITLYFARGIGASFALWKAKNIVPSVYIYDREDASSHGNVVLEVAVRNESEFRDVPNAVITLNYDPRLQFQSAVPSPRSGTNNVWDLGTLPADDRRSISITLSVINRNLPGTVVNEATLSNDLTSAVSASETTTLLVQCDATGDGIINLDDINAVVAARNVPTYASDVRDPDGDRLITVNDARICTMRCAKPRCAP